MNEKEYLSEEKYQKTEKILTLVAVLLLVVGLSIGGFFIYNGIAKPGTAKVEELKVELENKMKELKDKGVKYNDFAEYTDGDEYDLKVITEALDPSINHCNLNEYKEHPLTKEYCAAKNSVDEFASSGKIMIGVFICFATLMFSIFILLIAKRRHIIAFQAQQAMPVAKEGIDKMAPTIGNAAGEIAKGIKKGLNDEEK